MDNLRLDELLSDFSIKLARSELIELYNGRCIRCMSGFNLNVHEIEYKSQRPKTYDWWENQVTLCYDCHSFVHTIKNMRGVALLHDLQNRRLLQYYGRAIER